ncbi:protein xmas [Culicoides brevitarsis]|uniref:protein xmas n=1 Tax=Culicoides brevitarsis TaxID=469753 RepID=UPI00307C46A0
MDKSFGNLDYSPKSITCTNIPEEFLDKSVAKKHFGQFGTIKSFSLRPKNYSCSVEFENAEEAEVAKENGYIYNDHEFEIEFTEESRSPSTFEIDPDVQMELHAMKGGSVFGGTEQIMQQSQNTFIKRPLVKAKNEALNVEIEQLLRRQAHSVEDKYRILDARDKLIRQLQQNEKKSKNLIGTCPDMCPEKERLMRIFQNQVASFEYQPGTNQMDHKIAVKQYSRSSADQETPLPHELRPANVLRMSMNYLMSRIVDLSEDPKTNISDWFHFVWDRMRSIRKDITQQDLCTVEAVTLVEQCARFHIHSSARLVAEDPTVFDQKLNTENLTKCLQTLKYMYRDLRLQGVSCPNEPEFRAYVVLLNLNDGNFLWEFQQFSDVVLKSPELKFALKVYQAIANNNYVKFFQLVQETTYLNACILLRYFTQVRLKAVLTLLKAYCPKNPSKFSLKEFSEILAFEDFESTCSFLEYHGLSCDEEVLYLDKRNFYYPDFPFTQERSLDLVESKRQMSVGEIINGSPYSPGQMESLEKHQLQNSFDDFGYLKSNVFDHALKSRSEPETVFKVPTRTVSPRPRKSTEAPKSEVSSIIAPTTSFAAPIIAPPIIAPPVEKKIETLPSIFSLPTPPQSGSGDASSAKSKGFNFLQAIGSESAPKTPFSPFQQPIQPPKVISFPSIDFNSPPKKVIMQVEKTPTLSIDRTDSNLSTSSSLNICSPFTPLTPATSISSTTPKTDEKKMKQVDIELKLKEIHDSASKLTSDLVSEVTSGLLQATAEQEIARSKRLYEEIPRELLTTLLDEVLDESLKEISDTELLVEQILEARKLRSIYKVLKHWIFITRRNNYRKHQLMSTPFYSEPLSVVAKEFALPCHRRSAELFDQTNFEIPSKINKIDFFEVISKELKPETHNYWKAVVSYPDEKEDKTGKFSILMENWLKNHFSIDESGILTLKKYVKKLKRDLALSLETKKGTKIDAKTANGVIFIVNQENINKSIDRWRNLMSNVASHVPIAIVVCNNNEKLSVSEVESMLNAKKCQNFKIFLHSNKNTLKNCIEEGLKFVANNSAFNEFQLEMDQTATCLSQCLGEEFWCRVMTTIYENEALFLASHKESDFLVDVFNKALEQLQLILAKSFSEVIFFPEELRPLVGNSQKKYPMSFEQFPKAWSSSRNTEKLKNFLKSLRLPPFKQTSNSDIDTVKQQIASYVKLVVGENTKNVSRLVQLAQMQVLEVESEFDVDAINVSWIDIIRLLANQKLQTAMKELPVPTVVYDREEMQVFLTQPWWLTMDEANKDRSVLLETSFNRTQFSTSRKRKSFDDIDLNSDEVSKILKTGEATLKKFEARKPKEKTKTSKDEVFEVFRDAESYFKENQRKWKEYEEKLFGSYCELLATLLDEVLDESLKEISDTELLVEQILEARKLRSIYKVLKHWIFITRRNNYRKHQLMSTPFYSEPLSVVAKEFALPCHRRSAEPFDQTKFEIPSKTNKIDFFEVISKQLKSETQNYWKAVISYPDEKEDKTGKFSTLMENWLKNHFSIDESGILTLKKYVKKLKRDLALSLETKKGAKIDAKTANGVIFIVNQENLNKSIDRWRNLMSNVASHVPIAIVVCNNNEKSSVLENTLKNCIEEGLKFANNSAFNEFQLEMDQTATCLTQCLGEEFWCRVMTTIYENEALFLASHKESDFLVDVFNKALEQLQLILAKSFSEVIFFPEELRPLVVNLQKKFPMSFEQFPKAWNSSRNIEKLKNFLKSLRLPPFKQTSNSDIDTVKQQIASYVKLVVGENTKNVSRLVHLAQMQVLEVESEFDVDAINVSWIDIIRLLANQKLQTAMKELPVPTVVYDREEMQVFLTQPWWLTMDEANKDRSVLLETSFNRTQFSSSRKRKSFDDIDLNSDEVSKILKTGEATLKKFEARKPKEKTKTSKDEVFEVFRDAESYFKENQRKWKEYEEKLFGS